MVNRASSVLSNEFMFLHKTDHIARPPRFMWQHLVTLRIQHAFVLLPLTTSNLPQAVATGLLGASEAVPNRMPQPSQLRLRLKRQGRQQRIS